MSMAIVVNSLQSCYSIRVSSSKGTMNPDTDPTTETHDWTRGFEVIEINKVIKSSTFNKNDGFKAIVEDRCESGKLHSFEYVNSLGGSLLYLITFGSRRKIKLRYICMKKEN